MLKSSLLRILKSKVGKRVVFYPGLKINPLSNISIGDDVDLAWNVIITTSGGVEIGDRVLIGYGTTVISSNHIIPDRSKRIFDAGHKNKKVVISSDAWIGSNCVILPGVEIGKGAVVGAGSVVTKNVPEYAVVVGSPAKIIRYR